ncbi:MAG: ABC transporter permease [Anaerolineae bacterium]
MSRGEYLLRRLGLGLFVLLGVLMVTFVVSRVVPGDPARLYLGPRASPEALEQVRERLGLDDPLPKQFVKYVASTLRGDLGYSFRTKRPIIEDLKIRLPATMELVILSTGLALLVGVPVGVLGASHRGKGFDQVSRILTIAGVSIPAFWWALLLQLVFFLWLGLLPLGGRVSQDIQLHHPIQTITGFYLIDAAVTGNWVAWRDAVLHILLPACVLATYPLSLAVRMTRASMVEVLSEVYVTAARAQGLSEREILFRLALKNAILPTLTIMGLVFAYSITGAVLVEIVFTWPGMGSYMTDAILNKDIYVLFAVTLVVTVIYIFVNLLVDFIQAALDPRIRLGRGGEV